jgi:hypothetical protein
MRSSVGLLVFSALLLGQPISLAAEDAPASALGPQVSSKHVLTPEEKAQKRARKACQIDICDIVATQEPQGPDVACDIGWTWRADEITDAVGDHFEWPWGKVVCQSKIRLERAPIAKAMSDPRYEFAATTQTVRCTLHQNEGKPVEIELALAPKVTFRSGKATKGAVNWGDVSAPAAIYPLLYAATSLDNSTNVLGNEVVHQINKFIRRDCNAIKEQLPGRRVQ